MRRVRPFSACRFLVRRHQIIPADRQNGRWGSSSSPRASSIAARVSALGTFSSNGKAPSLAIRVNVIRTRSAPCPPAHAPHPVSAFINARTHKGGGSHARSPVYRDTCSSDERQRQIWILRTVSGLEDRPSAAISHPETQLWKFLPAKRRRTMAARGRGQVRGGKVCGGGVRVEFQGCGDPPRYALRAIHRARHPLTSPSPSPPPAFQPASAG